MPYKFSITPTRLSTFYTSKGSGSVVDDFFDDCNDSSGTINKGHANLRDNKVSNGNMSASSRKRLRDKINWLCALSARRRVRVDRRSKEFDFKISFVTLTLPAVQVHSHSVIKSKCLNLFLTNIREKFGVKNYVWKAELQKNGNVHFHLTFDKFIHYMQLRKYWNMAIGKLGYVASYREKHKALSFEAYCKMYNYSSVEGRARAKKAYNYGVSTNWTSPNTTDVKSVKNVDNLAAYLSKYLAKPLSGKNSTPEQIKSAKKWKGRTWFCSQSLSKMTSMVLDSEVYINRLYEWLKSWSYIKRYVSDWNTTLFYRIKDLPKVVRDYIREILLSHAINQNYPFPANLPKWN